MNVNVCACVRACVRVCSLLRSHVVTIIYIDIYIYILYIQIINKAKYFHTVCAIPVRLTCRINQSSVTDGITILFSFQ